MAVGTVATKDRTKRRARVTYLEELEMGRLMLVAAAVAVLLATAAPVSADAPSRVRELSCSDGTVFTGEQVRTGFGTPPRTFRNVVQGEDPAAFTFYAASVIAPDGTVVEDVTWDHSQGVDASHELVTCSFIIPIGDLTGFTAAFTGFFVPA
jgi:hypothetical protein